MKDQTTYYLEEDVRRVSDAWLATETEYMIREAAAIETIFNDNKEYPALVLARLQHLVAEIDRRAKIARYKPFLNGKINPDKLEDIKARLTPLEKVIGQFIVLRKQGNVLVAHCPFHEDRYPSFTVYNDHYFCFGCKTGGDVFSWLMQMNQGATFAEAVQVAANLAGVELRPLPRVQADERSLLT